jgi:hypothetical protein
MNGGTLGRGHALTEEPPRRDEVRGEFAVSPVLLLQVALQRLFRPHPSEAILWWPIAPTSDRSDSSRHRMPSLSKDAI